MKTPRRKIAATVTRGAVRCSAWLGVAVELLTGVATWIIMGQLIGTRLGCRQEDFLYARYIEAKGRYLCILLPIRFSQALNCLRKLGNRLLIFRYRCLITGLRIKMVFLEARYRIKLWWLSGSEIELTEQTVKADGGIGQENASKPLEIGRAHV